jgi:signal transduction histidine kinase
VRANRLLALYLFLVIWLSVLAVIVPLLNALLPAETLLVDFANAILSILVAILFFPRFQRFVNRRLLGITWSADQILETYAERIIACLDIHSLVGLLTTELLPSLLIRQSALLRVQAGRLTEIYRQGLEVAQLPADGDLPALLRQTGAQRALVDETTAPYPWAQLILPLRLKDDVIGLWLLGRRDPDDQYGFTEITTLQAITHQTAIAFTNIIYAERLRSLYENAIDQREVERASLSRELHDHTLQRLFVLKAQAGDGPVAPQFSEGFDDVVHGLTQTIRGLRPPMLEYGLYRAIVALVDDWANRPDAPVDLAVTCTLPEADIRYPHAVEQHLYRIVQQAGENALQHARPHQLVIGGQLELGQVVLTVDDDGLGLDGGKLSNIGLLEAEGHFGLAGMQERATLIGAHLRFNPAMEHGTRVKILWQTNEG